MRKTITLKNIVIVILISIFCFSFVRQQLTMRKIEIQINESQEELEKIKQNNEKLKEEVDLSKTDSYIEKMARERLGMIKPGEKKVQLNGNTNDSSTNK
ncbi:dihydroorotate dehydrogenase [Clostridium polyendosporum]|uniref:Dihydroorotate dehydrogenase n=1 Tax=Clostridium polyendosporum TaxID=69208 RepID=A0A919VHX3_9CLOT|nr:septum formation initiator family protein [Clostridium polyendosporum]GIM30181.1 dihydroorotate dehydrogenase [Clostridium polyendosporum]